jgi:hypothetical protein
LALAVLALNLMALMELIHYLLHRLPLVAVGVVKVLVEPDQEVEEGQTLLILEAMKTTPG